MNDLRLTPQQLAFFDTFGYLVMPGLISDVIDEVIASFEELWAVHGGGHGGKPHDGKARSCIVPFIDQHERLCALLDDPRVHGVLTSLLGDDFNYSGSDGNYYVGDTGWHSDGWHPPDMRYLKIAFYLDPLTRDNGALRVIPGSHRVGEPYAETLQQQAGKSVDSWGVAGRDVPAVALETKPGDLAIFNHNTKHASYGGSTHRRMFTINASQRYPEHRLPDLRTYVSHMARFWLDSTYGATLLRTATPQRRRHLEQILANEDHLPELTRKAKATMKEPSRG